MAGGTTTPELVAAVSNAGGLGSLGAAYLKPAEIIAAIERIRALTRKPFNVNLFAGGYETLADRGADFDPEPMLEILAQIHSQLGLPLPTLPPAQPCPFREQLNAVLEARPPVFSFTFGIPSGADLSRLKASGIVILGTATTVAEASLLSSAGVDGIVAQGSEAGAHRGTFAGDFEASMVPTLQLVREIAGFLSMSGGDSRAISIIASGGIMDGHDVARAFSAGASAAQLGTAFLCCPESGTSAPHKQAIRGRETGHDSDYARFLGSSGTRLNESLHRHGQEKRAIDFAFSTAELADSRHANCGSKARRHKVYVALGRNGSGAFANSTGCGTRPLPGRRNK